MPGAETIEARILDGVARGPLDREIGVELGYAPDTIKKEIERLMRQNGLRGRAQLGMWLRDLGYSRGPLRR